MDEPLNLDELGDALGLGAQALVAFVGGGGKTTTMFALGHSLSSAVVTTTTKMQRDRTDGFTTVIGTDLDRIVDTVAARDRALAWSTVTGPKAIGLDPADCDALARRVPYVLVEADGARRRPFTAPGPFEPVIPSSASHVVVCIGIDAVGRCIGDQCHRPLRIAAIAGCGPYDRLTPARAAAVLTSERGGRKGCPPGSDVMVAITKVTPETRGLAAELRGEIGPTMRSICLAHTGERH